MTSITVYDDTAKTLEEAANKMDTTVAEVIDALMDLAGKTNLSELMDITK